MGEVNTPTCLTCGRVRKVECSHVDCPNRTVYSRLVFPLSGEDGAEVDEAIEEMPA